MEQHDREIAATRNNQAIAAFPINTFRQNPRQVPMDSVGGKICFCWEY
ncbi:hypothetical protein [Microcoleus sp. bin38.metabat.b11b12b14.051]|nr:hypothetical protein [Microcoleus sp. bin38.metabat.b11b12b14.051]